jgi:GT2 family glycosyltransferase
VDEAAHAVEVSVVIVNYNTADLLEDCLESLFRLTKGVSYEAIVVDNASSDGSAARVRGRFPQVRLIESGENLGFGRANNLGAAAARGEYLFFLNSDTVLENDATSMLRDYVEAHPGSTGVVGAYLRNGAGLESNCYGIFPSYGSYLASRLLGFMDQSRIEGTTEETERRVDAVTGADMFMRASLFRKLGGFDPRFFMYFEETELQRRVRRLGLARVIVPGPRIVHREGGSVKAKMLTRLMSETSMYKYFMKTRGPSPGLWSFFIAYTFLGLFAARRYPLADSLLYLRTALTRFSAILRGKEEA